jgi:hypothetical protein
MLDLLELLRRRSPVRFELRSQRGPGIQRLPIGRIEDHLKAAFGYHRDDRDRSDHPEEDGP